jgi:hypothetical protein
MSQFLVNSHRYFVRLHENICNAIHLQVLSFYFDIIQKEIECVISLHRNLPLMKRMIRLNSNINLISKFFSSLGNI